MISTHKTTAAKIRSWDLVLEMYRVRMGDATIRVAGASAVNRTGSTLASSARNCSDVRPGASRPKTVTERIDGNVLGSSVGSTGSQNCMPLSKSKPRGITPMTV
jgi:hypothetical protein